MIDSKDEYIERVAKTIQKHDKPLAERLATPEGKALVAELDRSIKIASDIISRNDEVVGLLFANQRNSDRGLIIPMAWRNDEERDFVYAAVRACLLAYDIESYVTVCEGWACDQENYDPEIRNVDNPHRIEVLIVTAVSHELQISKQLEIGVDEHGDRCVLPSKKIGSADIPQDNDGIVEIGGTMATLLPPKGLKVSDEQRKKLQEILPFKLEPMGKVLANA